MSYHFSIPATPVKDFPEAAKAALEANRANIKTYNPDGLPAAELAVAAVVDLAATGIVGDGSVSATISGHGNPNHVAPSGWSQDCVTISLQRTDL